MAEFKEVMKEYKRMCDSFDNCGDCPFNKLRDSCRFICINEPEKAEQIILEWVKKNTVKTNRDKFLEVFGFDFITKPLVGEPCYIWANQEYKEDQNG